MKLFYFIILLIVLGCVEKTYTVALNQTRKKYRFSKNDTTIVKGGILSLKDNYFIHYSEFNNTKFISIGNPNDSFLHVINEFVYYAGNQTVRIGTEIKHLPPQKREYIKLGDDTYKISSVDSIQIVLKKIKETVDINNIFEPLLYLPNLKFQTMSNENLNLQDFQGKNKLILVYVWATWCSPCMQSMPRLDSIATQFNKRLQIISLNYNEDYNKFSKYAKNANILYGKIGESEYKKLNTSGMPHYALFSDKGELINYHHSIENDKWITSKFK